MPKKWIELSDLRRMLHYSRISGEFTWRVCGKKRTIGKVVGTKYKTKNTRGVFIGVSRGRYRAAVLAWFYVTGEWPKNEIDHKDGNGWNNSWNNLRHVTHAQNGKNLCIKKNNKTGVPGVDYDKKRGLFRVRIMVDRKEIFLGYTETIEEAALRRRAGAKKYYGEFARDFELHAQK